MIQQCINCESVWEDTSNEIKSFCSDECEEPYKKFQMNLEQDLYDADPNCEHELDPNCWSGIKCLKCKGWFCY